MEMELPLIGHREEPATNPNVLTRINPNVLTRAQAQTLAIKAILKLYHAYRNSKGDSEKPQRAKHIIEVCLNCGERSLEVILLQLYNKFHLIQTDGSSEDFIKDHLTQANRYRQAARAMLTIIEIEVFENMWTASVSEGIFKIWPGVQSPSKKTGHFQNKKVR